MQMLGSRQGSGAGESMPPRESSAPAQGGSARPAPPAGGANFNDFEDDIPF